MVTVCSTTEQYDQALKNHELVICDFHATWCGPCKQISPKFAQFATVYKGMFFINVDVDEVPDVAERAEVRAMPTFQIYKNGEKVEEVVGANPAKLEQAIQKYTSK